MILLRLLSLLLVLLGSLCGASATPEERAIGKAGGPIYVAELKGEVSKAQFYFLRRALKDAESAGASAFVIEMDTYGGAVNAAIDEMEALLKTQVPTYTYINSKALSAGALISLATRHIYMAPGGSIGAAAPVQSDGQDLSKTMADKAVSSLSAMARAAAERCGHNPDLADSFIRKEAELKLGETVVDRPESLLTLTAQEAARVVNGKPVLAAGIAGSLDEMLKMAGLTTEVRRVAPTGFERVASFLTAIAPLLLMGGILGAYVEIKTPGFGFPGIISAICFTLFFTGSYIAGLAGWEVVIFFVIGLVLIIMEVFVHPGTILPGLLGFFLMLGALLWAMVDRYPGQHWLPTSAMLTQPLVNLLLALIAVGIAIYFLARYLPRTTLYRSIVLSDVVPAGEPLKPASLQGPVSVGMLGKAQTQLRPSGKGNFEGRLVDVVTQGDLIDVGTPLRILEVEGARVVVAAL